MVRLAVCSLSDLTHGTGKRRWTDRNPCPPTKLDDALLLRILSRFPLFCIDTVLALAGIHTFTFTLSHITVSRITDHGCTVTHSGIRPSCMTLSLTSQSVSHEVNIHPA